MEEIIRNYRNGADYFDTMSKILKHLESIGLSKLQKESVAMDILNSFARK